MLTAIKAIINPAVVLDIATGDKILTLKELGTDSKIKKLHIRNIPENAFAFTLDHQPNGRDNRLFKQLSCYVDISNKKGINKGCDLILLILQKSRCVVLVFDLKSKKPNKEATKKQLINSELYVRYLMTMIQHHYEIDINSVEYKHTIVTTSERKSTNKTFVYKPNEKNEKMVRNGDEITSATMHHSFRPPLSDLKSQKP